MTKKRILVPGKLRPRTRPWHPRVEELSPFDRARIDAVIRRLEEPEDDTGRSVGMLGAEHDQHRPYGSIALLSPGCYMRGRGRNSMCCGKIKGVGVILYCATSRTSGKMYVGITSRKLSTRWGAHVGRANNGSHIKFHNAIRKYGEGDFAVEALYTYGTRDEAKHAEIELIAALNLETVGYNSSPGGDLNPMLGKTHTAEVREIIRQTHKGRKRPEETVARLRAANANVSQERREKIRRSRLGKKHTAATCAKLSASKRNPSPATREKMRLAHLGKTIPEHVRQKMRQAQINRAPEVELARREKCRQAAIRYWAAQRAIVAA